MVLCGEGIDGGSADLIVGIPLGHGLWDRVMHQPDRRIR